MALFTRRRILTVGGGCWLLLWLVRIGCNYKPVFDSYANLPLYVAVLLKPGLHETEVAKVIGGNFLRLFAAQE
jgi:hypothetical protein